MEITPQGFEREMDKLTPEQLDAPVDAVEAEPTAESVPEEAAEQKPEEHKESEEESEEEPEEVTETPDEEAEATEEESEEEPEEERVPKSRFLTMHQRAVEAERALRQFEAESANRSEEPKKPLPDDADLKKYYVEMFGEGELTDKLYEAELARLASIEEKAAERAFERLSQREQQEQELIEKRVDSFDFAFEELSAMEGKEFSDDEQVALLDIVEKYSPKDESGKLIGEYLMPLDQAYEIYQVQNAPKVQAKRAERNKVAALSGARSEGKVTADSDEDWDPRAQRRWWDKV